MTCASVRQRPAANLLGRLGEARLLRFGYVEVVFPAFVFEFDVLNQYGIGIRIELGLGLEFRDPAAVNLVAKDALSGFVINLKNDVFAKVGERGFHAQTGAKVPDLIGPLLEVLVVGHSTLKRDRIVLGAPRRFAGARGIAPLAMLYNLGGALQRAHLAD